MTSDRPYLQHVADSIAAIERYVAEGRDVFMSHPMVQDAVIRNFEIIGEAAGRLSSTTRASSHAEWAKVVAFRNRLIHGYWSVDPILVWDVISNELPALKAEVARLLDETAS